MKVTPLELRQRQFTTVMRGYDRAEVNTLLAQAADDFEALMLENDRLRQEAGKAEAALSEHRGQEKQLSNTLLTAQKIADDIREKAQHDAARFISEAEGRIAMMVEKSQVRVGEVQREIDALRTKRREVEISLEGLVNTLNKTIESVRDRDAQHEERTSLLLPTGRVEKPSVVLPLKDPSGSSTKITPAASSPASSPATPPLATPGPSVALALAPPSPATSAVPAPSTPTTSSTSTSTPPATPAASTSTSAVPATTSLLKPAPLAPPPAPTPTSSTPSTPSSAGPSAAPARPSLEAQPIRP